MVTSYGFNTYLLLLIGCRSHARNGTIVCVASDDAERNTSSSRHPFTTGKLSHTAVRYETKYSKMIKPRVVFYE